MRIRFDRFASQLVRERVWHASQQIQELTGGEVELRLSLDNLAEIEPWVLGWGEHAKVLGPPALWKRLAAIGRQYRKFYGD
ncbi:MAG: WYL domain-containing protein [Bdellovibrionaceae bacterium]|nr:WYL domain-containing protein [Pseudobdellovibrionaceae bacterium]